MILLQIFLLKVTTKAKVLNVTDFDRSSNVFYVLSKFNTSSYLNSTQSRQSNRRLASHSGDFPVIQGICQSSRRLPSHSGEQAVTSQLTVNQVITSQLVSSQLPVKKSKKQKKKLSAKQTEKRGKASIQRDVVGPVVTLNVIYHQLKNFVFIQL